MTQTLGEELSAALSNITALIIKTASKSERQKLTRLQARIAGELQVFIDNEVARALPEYKAATAALMAANAKAVEAKKKLDEIAATIKQFATAIDKLVALAGKVAA